MLIEAVGHQWWWEFRYPDLGIVTANEIHVPVGRLSFDDTQLIENARTVVHAVMRAKPSSAKGKYVISIYLASTMGPGVAVDPAAVEAAA